MGRELQKKKNRSGIAKVRQRNPKKTKRLVLGNAMIAQNWDKNKTVSQNYALLGLTRRLNGPTGGIERQLDNDAELRREHAPKTDSLAITPSVRVEISPQEAKIERDHRTGAILRVLDDNLTEGATSKGPYSPLRDPLNSLSTPTEHENATGFSSIIASLNAGEGPPKKRTQSAREEHWIKQLIDRHGISDESGSFDAMARDTELNIRQQSAGDLRRRVRKYLAPKS